jgi:hypothetical protein
MVIFLIFWTSLERPEERRPLAAWGRFVNAAARVDYRQPISRSRVVEPQRF